MLTFLRPLFDRFQTAAQAAIRPAARVGIMFIAGGRKSPVEMDKIADPCAIL
jgi:hypothetical protein